MEAFFVFAESVQVQQMGLLANSFQTLLGSIFTRPEFVTAQAAYLSDPINNFEQLMQRFGRLLAVNESLKTRDPYDTAFTTYLLFALKVNTLRSKELAKQISASRLNNLWWTRFALQLIDKVEAPTTTQAALAETTSVRSTHGHNLTQRFGNTSNSSIIRVQL